MHSVCIIESDPCPESPRHIFENVAHIAARNRKYNLADDGWELDGEYESLWHAAWEKLQEHGYAVPHCDEWCEECEKAFSEWAAEHCVIEPLYLYDHGGIVLRTSEGQCPWDTSLIGFVVVFREDIEKCCPSGDWRQAGEETISDEIEDYNTYLLGDVWQICCYNDLRSFCIKEPSECVVGFYGREHAVSEAKTYSDNVFVEDEYTKEEIVDLLPS